MRILLVNQRHGLGWVRLTLHTKDLYINHVCNTETVKHWVDVYYDVTLDTGEHFPQVSVENVHDRNANNNEHIFSITFELEDGSTQQASDDTISALYERSKQAYNEFKK